MTTTETPPLRRVTIRFANAAHEMVEKAAQREGVPLAQYIREAALMRVAWELGVQRGDPVFGPPKVWARELCAVREALAVTNRTG